MDIKHNGVPLKVLYEYNEKENTHGESVEVTEIYYDDTEVTEIYIHNFLMNDLEDAVLKQHKEMEADAIDFYLTIKKQA
jgi:hypothetical protein